MEHVLFMFNVCVYMVMCASMSARFLVVVYCKVGTAERERALGSLLVGIHNKVIVLRLKW